MSLRVYNTLTRQKELFEAVKPGKIGIYLCGPTVYKPPHIGHMVGPIIFDAIKRYLQYKGFDVTWVVNITDVDDKLIEAAKKNETTVQAMSERYTREYFDVLAMLGIDGINHFPKASDNIPEIISICQKLIEKGHAYAADGNVWFDVATDSDYGKLSNRKVEEQEATGRDTEVAGKRNPADFALWKAAKPGEPMWDSPWGQGRPGWHIECSAMSMKYLGPTFDFHGGGMDLKFPHHENELAQSESATGQPFARFWLHNGLTRIRTKAASGEWKQEEMHATTGNVIAARQIVEQHGADLFRYLLLSTHYRSPIDFSTEVIASSRKGLSTFARLFERVERLTGEPLADAGPDIDQVAANLLESEIAPFARAVLNYKMKFMEMMDDDFNTAGAIAVMHELAGEINAFVEKHNIEREKVPELVGSLAATTMTLKKLGGVLGLFRKDVARAEHRDTTLLGQSMQLLIRLRQEARAGKNFALADAIRKGLIEMGITLEDRPDGTLWRRD